MAVAVSVRRRRWQVPTWRRPAWWRSPTSWSGRALARAEGDLDHQPDRSRLCVRRRGCAGGGARRLGRLGAIAGWGLALLLAGGVLYGNALAYHEASVAPAERLHDLERIGERFAGIGPAFYPSHEEYAEYFLRESGGVAFVNFPAARAWPRPDAAGVRAESGRQQFGWEVDELDPAYLNAYELIVRRRGPKLSRPPSNWSLAERTRWHEVWRQTGRPDDVLVHQPLDSFTGKRSAVCGGFLDAVSGSGGRPGIAYWRQPLTVGGASSTPCTRSAGVRPTGVESSSPSRGCEGRLEGSRGRSLGGVGRGLVRPPVPSCAWTVVCWARSKAGATTAEFESFGVPARRGTHRFIFIRGGGNLEPGNGSAGHRGTHDLPTNRGRHRRGARPAGAGARALRAARPRLDRDRPA